MPAVPHQLHRVAVLDDASSVIFGDFASGVVGWLLTHLLALLRESVLSFFFFISRHLECSFDVGLDFRWHLLQNKFLEFFGRHHNLIPLLRVVILD